METSKDFNVEYPKETEAHLNTRLMNFAGILNSVIAVSFVEDEAFEALASILEVRQG